MNTPSSSDVRWVVVEKLYSRLQRVIPGTKESEIIEHAISLALNSGRQSRNASFLFHDVLRNARHSIRRTQSRRSNLFTAYSACVLNNIDYKTPEAVCIAHEIEAQIQETAAQSGPEMVCCLNGMLAGESITETAARCGLSRRSVNRSRQRIREISLPLF